jgi:hypothetical protein
VVLQSNNSKDLFNRIHYLIFRMRCGRGGGHWRHIQETNSHSGSNLVYINGRFFN